MYLPLGLSSIFMSLVYNPKTVTDLRETTVSEEHLPRGTERMITPEPSLP